MAESEKELKSFLMKMKEESEKAGKKMQHSKNEDHGIWSHEFLPNRSVKDFIFLAPKSLWMMTAARNINNLHLGRKVMTNLNSTLKSRNFANKSPYSQSYGFSNSHVWM